MNHKIAILRFPFTEFTANGSPPAVKRQSSPPSAKTTGALRYEAYVIRYQRYLDGGCRWWTVIYHHRIVAFELWTLMSHRRPITSLFIGRQVSIGKQGFGQKTSGLSVSESWIKLNHLGDLLFPGNIMKKIKQKPRYITDILHSCVKWSVVA